MTEQTTSNTEEPILTDRSRYVMGLEHCQMARYFQYHWAPPGHDQDRGIVSKSKSPDLLFGSAVHLAVEFMFKAYKAYKKLDDEPMLEWLKLVRVELDKELRGVLPGSQREELVELFWALSWAFYKNYFPWILAKYDVVDVEREELYNLTDVVQMSKPDLLLRSKATGKLIIPDFKTAKIADDREMKQYMVSVQHMAGVLGVEQRLNEAVHEYLVFFLLKGLKRAEYNTDTRSYDGPTTYNSPLIYGYYDPVRDDWKAKYSYKTMVKGKIVTKTIGKGYNKLPVWSHYPGGTPAWYEFLANDELGQQAIWDSFVVAGPYPVDRVLLGKFVVGMVSYEREWNKKMQQVKESPDSLDALVPRSWDCHRYGAPCQYLDICKDPNNELAVGWGWRRPHHEEELKRFERKEYYITPPHFDGLAVPDMPAADETK